jgi:hypothetical protein
MKKLARPSHNMTCKSCSRRKVYPEKAFGEWFYPSERTCFDCVMVESGLFSFIRTRKIPKKKNGKARTRFPLYVIDVTNNIVVGQYHYRKDVISAIKHYKNKRGPVEILVIHFPTYFDYSSYFA